MRLSFWLEECVSVLHLACWHYQSETNSEEKLEVQSPRTFLVGVQRNRCDWLLRLSSGQ